ncbi:hypothetical protein HNQ80_003296 [Anaerosolibacter carboniphilus]|uniref:Spo0E like sporulation regulatory protein n=1 Tax=Anaerosolibacter carboniphilus TaxID=1417629 RepID=A0A841KUV5_9FIRM|nr:aspartyl-phosphate phosphatase Spo0E family protein [Anaerosolibacter carboniphilus]MBB6217177.1 hypothetical protein [Anaerosolibacter carboniphilus]
MDDLNIAQETLKLVIEVAREHLEKLIEKKDGDLLHPDIISLSQFLDRLLSEYQKLRNN